VLHIGGDHAGELHAVEALERRLQNTAAEIVNTDQGSQFTQMNSPTRAQPERSSVMDGRVPA